MGWWNDFWSDVSDNWDNFINPTKYADELNKENAFIDYSRELNLLNTQYELEKQAVESAQDFEKNSAKTAMEFEANQADINRDWQSSANQLAMDFEKSEAEKNRQFQERMSNTAYQRAMDDMSKAGINPKLVAHLGGASTVSGATASGVTSAGSSARGYSASGKAVSLNGNYRGTNTSIPSSSRASSLASELVFAVGDLLSVASSLWSQTAGNFQKLPLKANNYARLTSGK